MNLLEEIKDKNIDKNLQEQGEIPLCPVCFQLMNVRRSLRASRHPDEVSQWYECYCPGFAHGHVIVNQRQESESRDYIKEYACGGWKQRKRAEYGVHVYFPLIEELTFGRKMLEIGFTLPYVLREARDRGWIVTGMDLNVARKSERAIEIIEDDFESHNFKMRKYDLIWASHVVEHFKDWKKAIEKIFSLLRPEGIAFISSPDVSLISKIGVINWGHWDTRHKVMFRKDCFNQEMIKVGFQNILLRTNEAPRHVSQNDFHGIWKKPFYDEPYIGGYDQGYDFDEIKKVLNEKTEEEKNSGYSPHSNSDRNTESG